MKKTRLNAKAKTLLLFSFAIMILFSFDSYATKVSFLSSPMVPAARGDVNVKIDKNKNYIIEIQIAGLAEVNRLQPSKHAYVVWILTDQEITKNLGQIVSIASQGEKKLKASFEVISPAKPIKIFITAENDGTVETPGDTVVLTTDRFFLK
ncbi:MAG: hypothetical protein NTW31_13320 [Bacteroidetes bacterium]|nr:hypothetical protein [Bacteroidota bacterium]